MKRKQMMAIKFIWLPLVIVTPVTYQFFLYFSHSGKIFSFFFINGVKNLRLYVCVHLCACMPVCSRKCQSINKVSITNKFVCKTEILKHISI